MASFFWGGGQNAVAKPLESAALDRAGTRARGAAPPAGHGPIRAPKLGAGVLDAVLHAARRARPPGPARPPRRRVPSRHGHERFRVSAGQAARRVRLGGGRRIFRRRRALRTISRKNRRGARPHAASDAVKAHLPPMAAHGMPTRGAPSSAQNLIFRNVSRITMEPGTPPRENTPTDPLAVCFPPIRYIIF